MKALAILLALTFSSASFGQGYSYTKKSSFSLMLGTSKTKLEVDKKSEKDTTRIYTAHEFDYGIQYQYRFGRNFKMGLAGTKQESIFMTLGFDW